MSEIITNKTGRGLVDPKQMDAQARLEELGYKQELNRTLSVTGNVVMALSNVSPVMAAFVFALAAFAVAGGVTASGAVLQTINVIFIGLILAELGSLYPVSGGLYSIIRYVLPRPLAYVAVFTFMMQALIYPPSIAFGVATYIQILFPQLPQTSVATSIIAAITLIIALLIGLKNIGTSNKVTLLMMVIQMIVIAIFLYVCFTNPQRSLFEVILSPQTLNAAGTGLVPASLGVLALSLGPLCATIDGYGASLGFSEETKGTCRDVGKAVLISAILTAVLISSMLIMSVVAAPNLYEYMKASSPLLYTAEVYLGTLGATLINIGVLVATFSCLVVIIMYMARVLYTGARDRVWPDKINEALTKVSSKSQIPWVATAVIAIASIALVFASNLVALVTFGGILAAIVYLLIAIGAVISRKKEPNLGRPFTMPLFPLPSIVVVIYLMIVIVSQPFRDMVTASIFVAIALIYYLLYIKNRDKKEEIQ